MVSGQWLVEVVNRGQWSDVSRNGQLWSVVSNQWSVKMANRGQ